MSFGPAVFSLFEQAGHATTLEFDLFGEGVNTLKKVASVIGLGANGIHVSLVESDFAVAGLVGTSTAAVALGLGT